MPIIPKDNAARRALLAWIGASLAVALPILCHVNLPLIDLPAHLARHYLSTYEGGVLDRFYEYRFSLVPNSAVDLMWYWAGFGSPERFSQIVMALYAVLFVTSTMVLARAVQGAWRVWPATAALLVYNAAFFWGFQNFLVSVPLAVLTLALWYATEQMRTWQRLLIFFPIVTLIYVMHLYAFIGLGLAAAGREIQRLVEAPKGARGAQFLSGAALSLPFVLCCVWLLYDLSIAGPNPNGGGTAYGTLLARIRLPIQMLYAPNGAGSDWIFLAFKLKVGLLVAFAIAFLIGFWKGRLALLTLERKVTGSVIALTLGCLAAPTKLSGVFYSDLRLPLFLGIMFFAATSWRNLSPTIEKSLAVLVAAVLIFNGISFERFAKNYDADIHDLLRVSRAIPEGARVLAVRDSQPEMFDARLWHVDAFVVIHAAAFIPTLFQGVHNFSVKPEWRHASIPQGVPPGKQALDGDHVLAKNAALRFMQNWQRDFTHILLLDPEATPPVAQAYLQETAKDGRFTLYTVKRP
ncbi:MAG: hypothetical protein JXJ18_01515 [Rhodobacteraceae bacterium]|nr:hypothetical protein [Paracoccaceae bacterium]